MKIYKVIGINNHLIDLVEVEDNIPKNTVVEFFCSKGYNSFKVEEAKINKLTKERIEKVFSTLHEKVSLELEVKKLADKLETLWKRRKIIG